MGFKWVDNKSIIDVILKVAGFTYGPLLGLFAFGITTQRSINDRLSIYVCIAAPLLIWGVDFVNNIEWYQKQFHLSGNSVDSIKSFSQSVFGKFKIGYELLIYNGLLTFLGLLLISKRKPDNIWQRSFVCKYSTFEMIFSLNLLSRNKTKTFEKFADSRNEVGWHRLQQAKILKHWKNAGTNEYENHVNVTGQNQRPIQAGRYLRSWPSLWMVLKRWQKLVPVVAYLDQPG